MKKWRVFTIDPILTLDKVVEAPDGSRSEVLKVVASWREFYGQGLKIYVQDIYEL